MPNAIKTTGTNDDPQETLHEAGQSIRDWVSRHLENVTDASSSKQTLTTMWTAKSGPMTVTTERQVGENDADFVERHQIEMLLEMLEDNPIP
jgi:hypothetical protein